MLCPVPNYDAPLTGAQRLPLWQGEVLVFELLDHPEATSCYAWEVDGEVIAVLGVGPVQSASDAVRASILAAEGHE